MARTVKIPDCSSTFDVFLNGTKYSFIGGTEVEVEDAVANIIEQHNKEHQPKEAPKTVAPFGAGGDYLHVRQMSDGTVLVNGEVPTPEQWISWAKELKPIMLMTKYNSCVPAGWIVFEGTDNEDDDAINIVYMDSVTTKVQSIRVFAEPYTNTTTTDILKEWEKF